MMSSRGDPTKVMCSGEGLFFGYIKQPIEFNVDTRRAGPGELTVYCDGPVKKAVCEITDNHNGSFNVELRPEEVGFHQLYVKFGDVNIPGSPFMPKVSGASLVHLSGKGLMDGLLQNATGQFMINTEDAGIGEVKVRVGGPRGYFRVETRKQDKKLQCRYNPRLPGMYEIQIFWSDDHVLGSPFQIYLCETEEELKHHITMSSLHGRKYTHIEGQDEEFGDLFEADSVR